MARFTPAEALARPSTIDRAKRDATTEDDIHRYQIEDGFEPDAASWERAQMVLPPRQVRERFGLTQAAFATLIGVPLPTYRNWEQGRTLPEPAARTLLNILAREPEAALRALGGIQPAAA